MISLSDTLPAGISKKRFCELMNINRSTLYYKPKGESEENLKYMEEMDKYSIDHPTAGVLTMVVKSEQAHPLGDGKNPFTGGQK